MLTDTGSHDRHTILAVSGTPRYECVMAYAIGVYELLLVGGALIVVLPLVPLVTLEIRSHRAWLPGALTLVVAAVLYAANSEPENWSASAVERFRHAVVNRAALGLAISGAISFVMGELRWKRTLSTPHGPPVAVVVRSPAPRT